MHSNTKSIYYGGSSCHGSRPRAEWFGAAVRKGRGKIRQARSRLLSCGTSPFKTTCSVREDDIEVHVHGKGDSHLADKASKKSSKSTRSLQSSELASDTPPTVHETVPIAVHSQPTKRAPDPPGNTKLSSSGSVSVSVSSEKKKMKSSFTSTCNVASPKHLETEPVPATTAESHAHCSRVSPAHVEASPKEGPAPMERASTHTGANSTMPNFSPSRRNACFAHGEPVRLAPTVAKDKETCYEQRSLSEILASVLLHKPSYRNSSWLEMVKQLKYEQASLGQQRIRTERKPSRHPQDTPPDTNLSPLATDVPSEDPKAVIEDTMTPNSPNTTVGAAAGQSNATLREIDPLPKNATARKPILKQPIPAPILSSIIPERKAILPESVSTTQSDSNRHNSGDGFPERHRVHFSQLPPRPLETEKHLEEEHPVKQRQIPLNDLLHESRATQPNTLGKSILRQDRRLPEESNDEQLTVPADVIATHISKSLLDTDSPPGSPRSIRWMLSSSTASACSTYSAPTVSTVSLDSALFSEYFDETDSISEAFDLATAEEDWDETRLQLAALNCTAFLFG